MNIKLNIKIRKRRSWILIKNVVKNECYFNIRDLRYERLL